MAFIAKEKAMLRVGKGQLRIFFPISMREDSDVGIFAYILTRLASSRPMTFPYPSNR